MPPSRSTRVPRLIAVAVATAGIITLLSAAFSPVLGRFQVLTDVLPLSLRSQATSIAALAGTGLLVVAGGLARRQRRAWWIALVLLVVAGVSHLLKDIDVPEAGVNLGMAGVLVLSRKEFDGRTGPGSIRRAAVALPLLATTVWGFGWLAIMAHADGLDPRPTAGSAAVDAFRGIVGLSMRFEVTGETGRWIPGLFPLLGVIVVVVTLVMVFRPIVEGLRRSPGDIERARALVRRHGDDTLAYFALREDKSYFFHGDVAIAYRYLWNLGLVSGDPIGAAADIPEAMAAFVHHARTIGWGVAVLAGSAGLAPMYADLGLRAFYLGDEALLRPSTFSLEGRPIRKVRQSCHRLERAGYRLTFLGDAQVGPDLQDALAAITRSWRGRAPERGFTMALGREPSPSDPDCLTILARDAEGRAQGYLHLVPCYGEEPGYSVDQMRRRPQTPNGLVEWMVARTTEELGRRGVERFSLNFSFLGGLLRCQQGLTAMQRVQAQLARRLSPFFQIESLQDFNEKFFPEWIPRYIYYEPPLSLPRVALAYLDAESFLRVPLIGARSRRRVRQLPERPPRGAPAPTSGRSALEGAADSRPRSHRPARRSAP